MRAALFALLLASLPAFAQYKGPAVEACRDYARREAAREGSRVEVVFEQDQSLQIERYTRKLGSQFVSSVLTGNGAVVLSGSPSAELSFICLLAGDKQPVFFNWLPRQNVSAMRQCTRDASLRGKARECLELLLRIAEADLSLAYAETFQDANARGGKVLEAYRKANEEWLRYREAECARRRDHAPAGSDPGDYQAACVVELTRRRALDLR